ncbi:MliC family protein [Hydrogenophaga sp.]|uniref:MliC family protein n=1 Tax=Hydrogenophaga sp. TaxID=1904254 RepID=UPI0025B82CB4|nr:MliC family protein [Hydrogenophaga sp.]
MKYLLSAVALALLLACSKPDPVLHPLHWQATPPTSSPRFEHPNWSAQTVVYRCAAQVRLAVSYLDLKDGTRFAHVYYQGSLAILQARPTPAGLRYIALDEQRSLRWNQRADASFLSFLAADHTATEQVLLQDCRAEALA